jgi:hypothetical protein
MSLTLRTRDVADVLRWPIVGSLVRHPRARLILQLPLLGVAAVIVAHGLLGPQIAPRNLATVLTWVHYRGLLVIALLAVGNLFCTACPMILARDAARTVVHPALRWPRILRTKWPALVLFAGILFAYELFDLWSLPRATAWLIIGYFAAALAIDVLFAGASFCKYVCPVGQFNFVSSTLSPAELHVRDIGTCRSCKTVDCIKGRREPGVRVLRGCELGLFLPAKVGNLDCTLCLDCVHACPHDNIALTARVPGDELSEGGRRSGIGRLTRRPDLAALAVLFTFGALLNAFAMTSPAHHVEMWVRSITGFRADAYVLGTIFVFALVLLPLALVGGASLAARTLGSVRTSSTRAMATRYAFALVPVGFGVWAAHYGFHFLTGALTIVPVTQSAILDLAGRPLLGDPLWALTGAQPGSIYAIQLGCLLIGMLGGIAVAYRISETVSPAKPVLASFPWIALMFCLAAAAMWVLSQPMEMRGIGFHG